MPSRVANANLDVARKQYDLTKAGAWVYDIQNQERQTTALEQAHAASSALLGKYTLRPRGMGLCCPSTPLSETMCRRRALTMHTRRAWTL